MSGSSRRSCSLRAVGSDIGSQTKTGVMLALTCVTAISRLAYGRLVIFQAMSQSLNNSPPSTTVGDHIAVVGWVGTLTVNTSFRGFWLVASRGI